MPATPPVTKISDLLGVALLTAGVGALVRGSVQGGNEFNLIAADQRLAQPALSLPCEGRMWALDRSSQ